MKPHVLTSTAMTGDVVVNLEGKRLGQIKDLIIDLTTGTVAFAVLARGGFGGRGERFFALPWHLLAIDDPEGHLVVDLSEEILDDSPGFDAEDWPSFTDLIWQERLHHHFDVVSSWGEPDVGVAV